MQARPRGNAAAASDTLRRGQKSRGTDLTNRVAAGRFPRRALRRLRPPEGSPTLPHPTLSEHLAFIIHARYKALLRKSCERSIMGIFDFGRTPDSRVPDGFQFRVPWHRTDQSLHDELRRELSPQHQLYGVTARAVARRQDNDDVLFELFGNGAPADFAVVHLTWSAQPDQFPSFPSTELYPTFAQWVADCMTLEADDWDLTESTPQ